MATYNVPFTERIYGHILVNANSKEEAEKLATNEGDNSVNYEGVDDSEGFEIIADEIELESPA